MGPKVVILSDGLWRRRFGADGTIVGREITLNDNSYMVIGVMPAAFENVLAPAAEVWSPLQYDAALPPDGREWGHHLRMVGRLRHQFGIDQAKQDLDAIARQPVPEFRRATWASLGRGLIVTSLQADITRQIKPALLAVIGAVLMLLAIACVNVTNLLLTRAAQRSGEFAMRAALGAGRSRLIRQLLTESVVLAVIGGVLGMLVADWGVRALVALRPPDLPRVGAIRIDGAVLAFSMGITSVIGIAIGLFPAVHARRQDLGGALQHGSRQTGGGHDVTRRVLVVAEVALALVLLAGAGLMLRSVQHLLAVDPGFDPSRVLTMKVQVSGARFSNRQNIHGFFERALEKVREVPGAAVAAFTSQVPLSGDFEKYGVQFESLVNDNSNEDRSAFRYAVTPDYFQTMRIPLREGRFLERRDVEPAPLVAVINESFAKRKFPGRSAIGERLHVGPTDRPWFTVVGIVGDVRHTSLALTQPDAVYTTVAQWFSTDNSLSLVVRTQEDATAVVPAIRSAIWSVDKDQPIVRIATMDALVTASASQQRFVLFVFQTFALVALLLAAVGIYGILSGSVTERTLEIGVRSALGASGAQIVALVVRQGTQLTGVGVVIGLVAALGASRAIETLLFGVTPLDPLTYAEVTLLLVIVSAIACCAPAWRAARIDPVISLKAH